jgi:hypothetical protein
VREQQCVRPPGTTVQCEAAHARWCSGRGIVQPEAFHALVALLPRTETTASWPSPMAACSACSMCSDVSSSHASANAPTCVRKWARAALLAAGPCTPPGIAATAAAHTRTVGKCHVGQCQSERERARATESEPAEGELVRESR